MIEKENVHIYMIAICVTFWAILLSVLNFLTSGSIFLGLEMASRVFIILIISAIFAGIIVGVIRNSTSITSMFFAMYAIFIVCFLCTTLMFVGENIEVNKTKIIEDEYMDSIDLKNVFEGKNIEIIKNTSDSVITRKEFFIERKTIEKESLLFNKERISFSEKTIKIFI